MLQNSSLTGAYFHTQEFTRTLLQHHTSNMAAATTVGRLTSLSPPCIQIYTLRLTLPTHRLYTRFCFITSYVAAFIIIARRPVMSIIHSIIYVSLQGAFDAQ